MLKADRFTVIAKNRIVALINELGFFARFAQQYVIYIRILLYTVTLSPAIFWSVVKGRWKLVDFGIAKLLERRGDVTPTATTAAGIMTPDYASLEQIRGGHISALADVYSLGVLLFELLVGTNPFAAAGQNLHDLLRRICEEEPPKPSAIATDARLIRKLRGELDNIILTGLRKEPERRYASVEAVDEDLRRYLEGLPVVTQGDSLLYRIRKFVGRYKVAVAVAIACVAMLAGGIAATRHEANIARQERARAEAQSAVAERARKVADEQLSAADKHRINAEQFAAEAKRERANAERRLEQMGRRARNAVSLYACKPNGGDDNTTGVMIAENARESLLMLNRERLLQQQMAPLLASTAESLEGYRLTGDGAWQVAAGWTADEPFPGNYRVALDKVIVHGGNSSVFLRSIVPEPQGRVAVSQRLAASGFKGSRVRLSVFLRSERIVDSRGICLNTVFGNRVVHCESLRVGGTSGWKRYEIVDDVPIETSTVEIKLQMARADTLWADDFVFEKVDSSVPLSRTDAPQNLNFIEPINTTKEKHK